MFQQMLQNTGTSTRNGFKLGDFLIHFLTHTHTHTHTQTHTQRNCSEMTDNVLKKSHFTVKVINSVTHHDT